MIKNKYTYLLFILALSSCFNSSDFAGFTKTDTGLHYKLQAIGDGKRKPSFGDYLQLNITYKTIKDSVFLDSYSYNETGLVILPFNTSSFKGSFEEGLVTMNEGDSVSFIVSANDLFKHYFKAPLPYFLDAGDVVKMDVKLHKIFNEKEYVAELERYQQLIEDRDIEEQRKLGIYLNSEPDLIPQSNGMYYQLINQGVGNFAQTGDVVQVHYKGCFLDGKPLESTYDRKQAMEFTLGEQNQVIKGLEYAISLLNEGAKAKFIIPSHLAFGKNGSSNGIVLPYTTLVYELELVKLKKHNQ
ncbi:MAG: FKBP-type peptidyl-prolyl cis-trans isomerase [Bacteroidia bacterium]|nr:FKBP-type peptidyl-prolyl cis-trans isomerase [Bacteroidia bacterium]